MLKNGYGPWSMDHRLTINSALYLCGMKILMVCLGNICRSPLAEGILQKKVKDAGLNWIIESAGTNSYHIGQPPHHLSQKVARKNGVDISCQKARKFTEEDFDRYDKIYAMANDVVEDIRRMSGARFDKNKLDLFLNELTPGQNLDVPDPWYGDEPDYHEVYKMLNAVCDKIVEKYAMVNKQSAISNRQ